MSYLCNVTNEHSAMLNYRCIKIISLTPQLAPAACNIIILIHH